MKNYKFFGVAGLTVLAVLLWQNIVVPILPKNLLKITKVLASTTPWNIKRDTSDSDKLKFYYGSTQPTISPLTITTAGEVKNGGFPVYGFVGYAEQDTVVNVVGSITPASNPNWTDLTGAYVTFTLPRAMAVRMKGNGSVVGSGGVFGVAAVTYGHCGFRFVVDETAYGHTTWGDQLLGCNAGSAGNPGWWCPWNIEREVSLSAGSHTAKLQMAGWSGTTTGCTSDAQDYSRARLWVDAR